MQFKELIWRTNYHGKDLFKFKERYEKDNLLMKENGLNFIFTGLTLDYLVDLTEEGIEKWKKENEFNPEFILYDYHFENKYGFNLKPIETNFELNGLEINSKVALYSDVVYKCPFSIFENEDFIWGHKLYEMENRKTGKKMRFSNVVPHMIKEHHFFGGRDSENRLEIEEFSKFLD